MDADLSESEVSGYICFVNDLNSFENALERYYDIIFQKLQKLSSSFEQKQQESGGEGLSSHTFWQYTKLPKLVSDRIFAAYERRGGLSDRDFIEFMKTLTLGSQQDQVALVFAMLDFDSDGLVYREDGRVLLSHTLAHPRGKSLGQIQQAQRQVESILNALFKRSSRFTLLEYQQEARRSEMQERIISFIKDALNIDEKVNNFWTVHPQVTAKNSSSTTYSRKSTIRRLQTMSPGMAKEEPAILQEGVMMRLLESKGLKCYYYRLINTELFVYRNEHDPEYKAAIHLSSEDNIVQVESDYITEEGRQTYAFKLEQPDQVRVFYHTDKTSFQRWMALILKIIGKETTVLQEYQFKETIGSGRFGVVKRAKHLKSGAERAIKIIQKNKLTKQESKLILQEREIQEMCHHDNLLGLLNFYQDFQNIYLVSEYMEGGTLSKYIKQKQQINHVVVRGISHQIAMGLYYLRTYNIAHRDIKPENILLSGETIQVYDRFVQKCFQVPVVKIADFGLSIILGNEQRTTDPFGTITYVAPEIIKGQPYNYSIDIYSFGVVMYYMLSGRLPFYSKFQDTLVKKILQEDPVFSSEYFWSVPIDMIELLFTMLRKKGSMRIRVEELLCSKQLLLNDPSLRQSRKLASSLSKFTEYTSP